MLRTLRVAICLLPACAAAANICAPGAICYPNDSWPRLWMTAARVQKLNDDRVANTAQYAALKTSVDAAYGTPGACTGVSGSTAAQAAFALAVLYQAGAGTAYGTCAVTALQNAVAYWGATCNENCYRGDGGYIAMAYDWAHGQLAAGDRDCSIAASVCGRMLGWLNVRIVDPCCIIGGNFWTGQLATSADIAATIYGETGASVAQTRWNTNLARFTTTGDAFSGGANFLSVGRGQGGGFIEGVQYDTASASAFLRFMEHVKTATGQDLYPSAPEFPRQRASYIFQSTSPASRDYVNRCDSQTRTAAYELMPFGDQQCNNQGYIAGGYRSMMLHLGYRLLEAGYTTLGRHVRWWLDNIQPTYRLGAFAEQPYEKATDFLFYDTAGPSSDYRTAAGTHWFTGAINDSTAGAAHVLARADVSTAATWVWFGAQRLSGNHRHPDALDFAIYRQGKWLAREETGYGLSWTTASMHNTLVLAGHGQCVVGADLACNSALSANGPPVMRRHAGTAEYVYAQGDATQAYQRGCSGSACDVTLALRDFLYLRPDIVVIWDRVTFGTGATYKDARWNLNSLGTLSQASGRITVTNGTQRLYVNAVAPSGVVFSGQIDNKDRYAYVSTKANPARITTEGERLASVTMSGATGQWAGLNGTFATTSQTPPNDFTVPVDTSGVTDAWLGQWVKWSAGALTDSEGNRMVWQSPGGTSQVNGMMCLQAAAAGDAVLACTALSAGNVTVAEFGGYVVAGNSAASGVTLPTTYSGYGTAARTHVVVGLDASTTYKVDRSTPGSISITAAGPGDAMTTSAAGVLAFGTGLASRAAPR